MSAPLRFSFASITSIMSATFPWGRYAICVAGLLLVGVWEADAQQPEPQSNRVRAALLYGPSGPQQTADTTNGSSRRLEATLHLGGGLLASGGAVAGGIQAATLLNEGANRPIGAVLAAGSVGLGVAGVLLIWRGVQLLRQDQRGTLRSDMGYRGKSPHNGWNSHRPAIRIRLESSGR